MINYKRLMIRDGLLNVYEYKRNTNLTIYTKYDSFLTLKMDMPILTCIFFTFNWLTLTSEMDFAKFHPEVASCLLSRGKRKYAPLGILGYHENT